MGIEGIWYNELGSQMIIEASGTLLTGTYKTNAGTAACAFLLYGQLGAFYKTGQPVAWTVLWQNELANHNCITSWCGQYLAIDGHELLMTNWLLTIHTDIHQEWFSTKTGKDMFTRHEVNQLDAEINELLGSKSSHPQP